MLAMSVGALLVAGRLARDQIAQRVRDRSEVSAQLNAALIRDNLERYRPLPFALARDVDVREARAAGEPDSLGVVVFKVESQRLEADWRRQTAPVFATNDHGGVLLSSQDEWRFRSLVPRPDGTKQTLRASLQHSDAEFAPLALTGDRDALIRLPVWGESNERYLHIQTLVPSVSGWHRHVLAPAGKTIAWATYAAQITTLLAVLLLVGGVTVWRQRHCRRVSRELERARRLERLESQVNERTHELASSNRQLAHEIEARARTEHRVRRLQGELDQAGKLSALGQITAGVAHEINQPVTAIRSYAENAVLLIARNRHHEAASNMQAIAELTERIGRITAELRQFARRRVDDNRDRRADIAAAINSAVLLLNTRQRRDGLALQIDMKSTLTATIEPLRLEQILINLLTNAIDALHGIAQPSIRLTVQRRLKSEHVEGPPSPMLEIVVRDNGPGMDAARRAALFTPFSTGKPDGLGLGLVISRELAREVGGDLEALPSDGDGSVFVLTLPVA